MLRPRQASAGTIRRSRLHRIAHASALVLACTFTMWIVCLVALAVFAGNGHTPRRYDLVIAAGTDTRVAAGENPLSLPANWNLVSGDVLVLDNRDATPQTIGAWTVGPGEVREVVLRPFSGLVQCTLHPDGAITMNVHPARTDWKLALMATLAFGPMLGIGAMVVARVMRSLDDGPARPRGDRWLWWTTAVLAAAAVVTGVVVLRADDDASAATLDGFVESPARDVGTLSLPDAASGAPVSFVAPEGGVLLVVFGYTSCPDVCPTTMSVLAHALTRLGADASRVQLDLVSVDPQRDDPATLTQYVQFFVPDGTGLRTDDDTALHAVADGFGATYDRGPTTTDGTYEVSHTALVYGVDSTGHVVVSWPSELGPEAIAHDLRLLLEGARPEGTPA